MVSEPSVAAIWGVERDGQPGEMVQSTCKYLVATEQEWSEFDEHFDRRKVELGSCARPYGTGCEHEHACISCPMLNINPKMLPRLRELKTDLMTRRGCVDAEGWLGELEAST